MATDLSNGFDTAGSDPNVMGVSEHVDGFIDVDILIDIHECLSESKSEDDRTLAVWVKANYLKEPINVSQEAARLIRNPEGYVNLDKAYRRARTLTGKAQDKWPFLGKEGKKLSSTRIKNEILRYATMGAVQTESSGRVWDTPMSVGLNGHRDNRLETPQSQASLSANDLSRHQAQTTKSPQPVGQSLRQQDNERKTHRQDHSPVSAPNSTIGTPSLDGTANGTPTRDAESGKVRGPDGRYVNKDNSTPPAKKKSDIKSVKKPRTGAALEGKGEESEEIAKTSDEEVEEFKRTSGLDRVALESEREAAQDSSERPVSAPSAAAATHGSPLSAILAAEAEAVPSNLDRLPSGHYALKKRKSESGTQRGGAKRGRGSRGGILGRPRKSETFSDHGNGDLGEVENMEVEEPTSQSTTQPDTPVSASARRSSRKSAVLALETSTPWDPIGDVLFSGAPQEQPPQREVGSPPNGSTRPVDFGYPAAPPSTKQKPKAAAQAVNGGPSSSAKSSKASSNKRVSFSPETRAEIGNIVFFARITTSIGDQEVRLSEEDVTHEVDLVKKYAQWLNDGKASVDFDTFKQIFKLSRAG